MGAEVLSPPQLGPFGQSLVERHQVLLRGGPNRLLARLDENAAVLHAFNGNTRAIDRQIRQVTPAAEWLLDNAYLIDEQILMARRHLPGGYSRELLRLADGPSAGLPRVYDLMLEFISHVDAQLELDSLTALVAGYQGIAPLTLGELWAVPIMLRLGLLENLRRITLRLTEDRASRNVADHWVDQLEAVLTDKPTELIGVVADLARAGMPQSSAFISEFSHRISRLGPTAQLARSWLEQCLASEGRSIEHYVLLDSQRQAAEQVSVSHSIASLRRIGTLDWREFVETLSLVDQALQQDPAGVYGRMDFATRDQYRHVVESIARHSQWSEIEIAEFAVARAHDEADSHGTDDRKAHVGFHLIDAGRDGLEQAVAMRCPLRARPERWVRRHPSPFYLGGILAITLIVTVSLVRWAQQIGIQGAPLYFLGMVLLLGASQLGVALMNWLVPLLVGPRLLPRLDFSAGLPADCRTMVVIPTLLTDGPGIERLLEFLEIHHLGNLDHHLHFALLTDFTDAPAETQPEDPELVDQVRAGIERLNGTYGSDRFFLLHRPRRWNPAEGVWMGYERKRGKLLEFNGLLRGRGRELFSTLIGDLSILTGVRFVITLDTDTQLPRDTARRLVGTIAHPLNRPINDPETGIVTQGYGILQPRIGISLPSAGRSWFVRLFAGDAGIDPYTRAVSDVYQDVFNEGSFIGKGIYDVDAFERAVAGRFPENTILSHDLIESAHARSALVSDVELYEEHPSHYNVDVSRRHRWIRGDWQIAPWLLPRVPGADARWIANPLSGLSRWKLFDNLRRSLVPTALLLVLWGDWMLSPTASGFGPLVVVSVILLPVVLSLLVDALRKPSDWPLGLHCGSLVTSAGRQLAQVGLTLAFLPYDAWVSLDAVLRTLGRLLWTRRRLLEWKTSVSVEQTARTDLESFYRTMWIAPAVAAVTLGVLGAVHPDQLMSAAPFVVLWLTAPASAWWISRPLEPEHPGLTARQRRFLRRTARQTWGFFETLVTAGEHWLPPDNLQETPRPVVAGRTSPTNLGLALLANLAARDFGYISLRQLVRRTTDTLATMERLERHRGHFYNWYDTRTLKPLPPLYVSTVDSGNLAGHLLTLGAGLLGLCDRPVYQTALFAGLRDTLGLAFPNRAFPEALLALQAPLPQMPAGAVARLDQIRQAAEFLEPTVTPSARVWLERFHAECQEHAAELRTLLEGTGSPAEVPGPNGTRVSLRNPTLRQLARSGANPQDPPDPASATAAELLRQLENLALQCSRLAAMDFAFLYDPARRLFTIGYNVSERRRDASYYDLLASEARLCSFVAIAQGQVPQEHWFTLGRLLGQVGNETALLSWSGSMFEYLMPLLVMPNYDNSLLDRTCRVVVDEQIRYGRSRGVPWGISESGYLATDAQSNYQYRAFGVPRLGFQRGLAEDLVIAPYASLLALMVCPAAACRNLERLDREGRIGEFGFYEAVDYTESRLPPDQTSATVRSFMAHHQGMALLALAQVLLDRPMQRRFLTQPGFRATELLLQERIPRTGTHIQINREGVPAHRPGLAAPVATLRVYDTPHTPQPEVHLLSNGRYQVMISQAGGGYSRWGDLAVTRWHEDPTRDSWGNFCYVRDTGTDQCWSTTFQPMLRLGERYEAIFTEGRAEFRQRHGHLEFHEEIGVSPEDDVELRRLTLTNHGPGTRTLELTTYAEVVLAPAADDAAHPVFSNLFVQTEFEPTQQALLCTRRSRSDNAPSPWLVHLLRVEPEVPGTVSYETDRARFLGRGRTPADPAALQGPLSGTTGSVLDPIVSLRRTVTIGPDESVRLEQITGVAADRAGALGLAVKYNQPRLADRLFDLAWTGSQVTLRQLDCTEAEAQEFGRLAGALVQADPARRAAASLLLANRRGQHGLWSYGISGDHPIVLLRIADPGRMDLVRRVVRAHSYWRIKGLTVDLVILNEDSSVYRQTLHEQIVGMISVGLEMAMLDKPGGIFVRRSEQIPLEDRTLFQAVARVVLSDENGSFSDQVQAPAIPEPPVAPLQPRRLPDPEPPAPLPKRNLTLYNGIGGFTPDGREYVITLPGIPRAREPLRPARFGNLNPWWSGRREPTPAEPGPGATVAAMTPAPWVNVLANPYFGTVISESGSAYSWLENCHEFRLTPWHNDPVSDPPGEAFYVRDEETGVYWSPTPLPARGTTPYVVRHGFGQTVFEHKEQGLQTELTVCVAPDAPVKINLLRVRNVSGRTRRLTLTGYWEWVLGESRTRTALHVQTWLDPKSGALLVRNPFHPEFADRVAFVDTDHPDRSLTGDRREFIGRNRTLANPAALRRVRLSGRTGPRHDPCGALQVALELGPGEEREVTFRIGAGRTLAEVQYLVQRFRRPHSGRSILEAVGTSWNRILGAVQWETPDPALNVLVNGWLLYQALSARLWGRTGFYQSGGAFGFRDQLQDAMAFVHADPGILREQLLRAASRQFTEGDVQHWWHPPGGRGVRTRISDDYLWLPYAVARHLRTGGDAAVLDEPVPYLQGRALRSDEESYYDLPHRAEQAGTLYEHCTRAIEHGLRLGEHGLPLIGTGDWNDGFNRVGAQGRGESVWLGFFLHAVLKDFAEVARRHGDDAFAERCLREAAELRKNLGRHAWDGQWYLRAWFDDGTPLGSKVNPECRIDSLPQSWAVLSGAGDPDRSRLAMDSVLGQLVRWDPGLVQLFDPPFDQTGTDPGYVRGYVPGVRENGGQYTHAAVWAVMALAELGDSERAWDLLNLINPVRHGATPEGIATYKVEPYVMAADVYAVDPHLGRGGWTWYTGAAGWMYRLITESLLGLHREGDWLRLEPHLPAAWPGCRLQYRHRETLYRLTVDRGHDGSGPDVSVVVDGESQPDGRFQLVDDQQEHQVTVHVRSPRAVVKRDAINALVKTG